jgi:predicted nucleic acid-binding protein
VIESYGGEVSFLVSETALAEAEEHLAELAVKHGGDPEKTLALLRSLSRLLEIISADVYAEFKVVSMERLAQRDPDDWPMLACAIAFQCPIWTEDTDFFGCGVATWTSDRVRLFLQE